MFATETFPSTASDTITNGKEEMKHIGDSGYATYRLREELGAFNTLFAELKDDHEYFYRYARMKPNRFQHLLSLVRDKIERRNTQFRKAISGEGQQSLAYTYRMGSMTASQVVSFWLHAMQIIVLHCLILEVLVRTVTMEF